MENQSEIFNFSIKNDISLLDLLSKNNGILLVFFPFCNNVLTLSLLKNFRDSYKYFKDRFVDIIAITTDNQDNINNLSRELMLQFPIIQDENGRISSSYNLIGDLGLTKRKTLFIDSMTKIINKIDINVSLVYINDVLQIVEDLIEKDKTKTNYFKSKITDKN